MLWQCLRNIKTNEDYNPPHDSPPPITLPHPHPHLSSPHPSLPPSPIPRTWHSKTHSRTLLLLSHYLLPLSPQLLVPWQHPSPHGWTVYLHLPTASYMLPSVKAPWPTRHSVPYPTSLLMTLSSSSLSFSRFTQPFTPFSPGPPGAQQVPLIPSRPLPLRNLLPSSPSNSAFLRHENLPLTFYMSRDSTIPSPSSPIIDAVLSPIILLLSESEQSTFYADHPLPTGLPQAYWAATTFSNSSLTVNISWSSLTNRNDTISESSPQRTDSNATLVPTIPFTPTVPSTPTVIPPSGPPSSRSPPISHTPRQRGAVIFTTGLASTPATSNVHSALGATPKQCPPPPANSVEPIPIPTPASLITGMDDCSHSLQIIPPATTIPPEPSNDPILCSSPSAPLSIGSQTSASFSSLSNIDPILGHFPSASLSSGSETSAFSYSLLNIDFALCPFSSAPLLIGLEISASSFTMLSNINPALCPASALSVVGVQMADPSIKAHYIS